MRLLVDDEPGARGRGKRERVGQRQGPVAVAAQDPVAGGLGAGRGMGVDRAPLDDAEAFGGQRLDAEIVDPGADCGLDAGIEQFLEDGEEPVLQSDAQGQHAVEELRDRRQFLAQGAVLVAQIETGRLLELGERTALDLARAWISW